MLARKSALIVSIHIANALLGYIALLFITRFMEPSEYGLVAFALGFVTIFTIFGSLGFNQAHIKRISEGKDLGTCNGTFIAIKSSLICLMIIITLATIFIWRVIIGRGFESSTHEIAIYIMIVYWAIKLFADTFVFTFNAKKEIAKAQIPSFLMTLTRVAVTMYIAIGGFGSLALAFSYVLGEVIHLVTVLFLFRGYPVKKPSKEFFKDYSKFAFPLIIVVASTLIMTNIDKVFIQLFWSASDVGYYFASYNLSKFVDMFTLAIGILLFPTYSALHSKNNIEGIRKLTYRSERYLSMIVFPMVFGLVVLAEPATFLLLSGWMPAVPILQILPFYALFDALSRPYGSQVVGMNRPDIARNRVVIMVIANVLLNLILIPNDIRVIGLNLFGLGARGAAIATIISYSIGLIYNRAAALKLTGVKGNPRVLLHLFAAAIMAISLYFINTIFIINRWFLLLGISFIGLGIYLTVLYFLNEFDKKDLNFFLDTLNIKKMFNYIRDELRFK